MARAVLRGVTSPGFMAPASRALEEAAETLGRAGSSEIPGRLSALLQPSAEDPIATLIRAFRQRSARPQLADDGRMK